MPYAAKNQIAQDEFEGAVEITPLQYAEALEGLCNGLEVSIENGFKVAPAPPPEEPSVPVKTIEEIRGDALSQRDQLLNVAAIRIWQSNGLNELADNDQFTTITRRINGGLNGLENRMQLWARAKAVLWAS